MAVAEREANKTWRIVKPNNWISSSCGEPWNDTASGAAKRRRRRHEALNIEKQNQDNKVINAPQQVLSTNKISYEISYKHSEVPTIRNVEVFTEFLPHDTWKVSPKKAARSRSRDSDSQSEESDGKDDSKTRILCTDVKTIKR